MSFLRQQWFGTILLALLAVGWLGLRLAEGPDRLRLAHASRDARVERPRTILPAEPVRPEPRESLAPRSGAIPESSSASVPEPPAPASGPGFSAPAGIAGVNPSPAPHSPTAPAAEPAQAVAPAPDPRRAESSPPEGSPPATEPAVVVSRKDPAPNAGGSATSAAVAQPDPAESSRDRRPDRSVPSAAAGRESAPPPDRTPGASPRSAAERLASGILAARETTGPADESAGPAGGGPGAEPPAGLRDSARPPTLDDPLRGTPAASGPHRSEHTLFLSMRQCIQMAIENNPDILISKFDPELNHYDVGAAYGAFTPTLFGSLTSNEDDRETGSALSGAKAVERDTLQWTTGLRGLFYSGLTYELSVLASREDSNSTFATLDPNWTTAAGWTLRQPLLKNFGARYNRRNILIARRNKDVSLHRFLNTTLRTVFAVQEAYLNLVFALRDKEVKDKSLKLAEKLLEVNRNKVRVGAMAPIEEVQAEAQVAAQLEGIILAEKAIEDAEDVLKRLIRPARGDLSDWNSHIYPTDPPFYEEIQVGFDEQVRTALIHRPDYLEFAELKEIQDIQIMAKENDLKPSVDLQWKYTYNGLEEDVEDSFRRLASGEFQTYEIGLFVEYPLGTRAQRSGLKRAEAERRRIDVQQRSIEQVIVAEVREAVRGIGTSARRIEATRKASELARKQLEADEKRLELGLSTSFQVLQFQEDLAEAERNETKAVIDHMLAILKLYRVNGTLLEKMGIQAR